MPYETDRRSFLGWATVGLGAIFSAIFGAPIVAYILDPRHRTGPRSDFKLVEGVKLDELAVGTPPKQGTVRDTRTDGWTLYPNDVIGRVWVVQIGARPANPATATAEAKAAYLVVFTTICPHLGCSVNLNSAGNGFACPCHSATFHVANGDRATDANPAKRGMDTLEWEFDDSDPDHNRIKVKYQNFVTSIEEKKTIG